MLMQSMSNRDANTMIVYLIDSLTKSNTNRMEKKTVIKGIKITIKVTSNGNQKNTNLQRFLDFVATVA